MTKQSRFGVVTGVFFALNVTGLLWIRHDLLQRNQPAIRVLAALPTQNVDQTDRLSLVFDSPVTTAGLVGKSLDQSPFMIEPQPEGYWAWAQPDRLDYVLSKRLPPGRIFTVKSAPDIEMQIGRALIGQSIFRFQTRPLELAACRLGTADRNDVTVEMIFNQRVSPDDLLRNIELHDPSNWQWLTPVLLTREPAEQLTIRVRRPKSDALRMLIKAALTGTNGQLALGEQLVRELNIPKVFALVRAEASEPALEKNVSVDLHFSKALDREQPAPPIHIAPAVPDIQVRVGETRLTLEGPFESGKRYTATVSTDLLSKENKPLEEEQSISFEIPEREPSVCFPMRNGILSPGGNLNVELKAVNVAGLVVSAARVHANNLCAHLRGDRKWATSREMPNKTLRLDLARNVPTTLALDLRQLLGQPLGVYSVEAEALDHNWTDDAMVVVVTDLAITAKAEREGFWVWVTSLRTAKPLAAVEVAALTYNGQSLSAAVTDTDGIARLRVPKEHPDGAPWILTARLGDDLNYLWPEEQSLVIDNVDLSGRERPTTYDIMLYAERGVYRPGDTIHLTGIIRDTLGGIPPAFPVSITVRRPDGREVAWLPVTPAEDGQGVFHVDYATCDNGRTGPYRFSVGLPGAKKVLGRTNVLVEEFIPSRLEITAEPTKPRFGPNDEVSIDVTGRYLFDQPTAGLPVTVGGTYHPTPFISKRFENFCFDGPDQTEDIEIPDLENKLDEQGHALVKLTGPDGPQPGLWRVDLTVTVTETGGRSVSSQVESLVDTSDRHVGLRLPAGLLITANSPVQVEWVQVTDDDEPAIPGPMSFTLYRVDYDTVLQDVDGRLIWKSIERLTTMSEGEIENTPDGKADGRFEIICPTPDHYRLQVVDCFSDTATQLDFDATDDSDATYSLALNRPEQLELVLDKQVYTPGSLARLLVKSPFPGTLLLTVETDRVMSQQVLQLNTNSLDIDLPVDESLRGGAFINATVVRQVDPAESTWLPHRAVGIVRLATEHSGHKLPVSIIAPQKAQPGQNVQVAVQTQSQINPASPPVVHLWAVDEGILLTTAYKTPDPLGYFFAPVRAEITSADIFGDLLPDHQRPASMTRIGGDGSEEDGESLRRTPVPGRHREAAVVWRTTVPMSPDGTVTADLTLPDMVGEMRLMAVVVDHDQYGSAEQALTLTAPLLVEMSWPRFAAPNDRFDVPAKLFNSTNETLMLKLVTQTEGPVTVTLADDDLALEIKPGRPMTTWLHVTTTGMGQARVRLEASTVSTAGPPLTAAAEAEFPVRPAGPLHAESRLFHIKAGEPFRLESPTTFLPGTTRTTLSIGSRPSVQLQPALEQLIDYPYGCVEQTTSRLFALLYAPDLLTVDGAADTRSHCISDMIDAGIARLWSMQTRSGGLGYWPDSNTPNLWGTAYAADFLIQAREAGRKVDAKFTEEIGKYLQAEFDRPSDEPLDDNTRAHLGYILTVFKHPPHGWLNRLSDRLDQLDMAGRAHLAAAWLELGRKDRALAVLTGDLLAQSVATTTGARLTSQVHQEAVLLGVLLDLDRDHPAIPLLVERLEKARQNGQWGSTLENASALAALARYQMLGQVEAMFQGAVRINGAEPQPFDHQTRRAIQFADQGWPIEIESSGHGDLYLSATTQGLLRQDGPVDYDHQLKVSRRWTDRQGQTIDPTKLKVGDLVLVETTLLIPTSDPSISVDNIAIVDALPGGLEVENPRLVTSAGSVTEGFAPDRIEFRDDRIVLFASATSQKNVFRYALRAITAGSFELPPIQASCMYDAGFASVHGGGRVEIAR